MPRSTCPKCRRFSAAAVVCERCLSGTVQRRLAPFETFIEKQDGGCWIWCGRTNSSGYGAYGSDAAHRYAYAAAKGEIPAGLQVCHTCDVPACVNPEHLWLGTIADNLRDMFAKGRGHGQSKTHCKNGHEYSAANTYHRPKSRNRDCRACIRARVAAYEQRKLAS